MLEVGDFARDKLGSNVGVLISVARMYMSAHKLAEAQGLLVSAGKLAPREAVVYRVLGEVLIRRGDAERAEKVFERAQQFGDTDVSLHEWLDRARALKGMQGKAGPRAVAMEIERLAPANAALVQAAAPPPPLPEAPRPPADSISDEADTSVRGLSAEAAVVLANHPALAALSAAHVPSPVPSDRALAATDVAATPPPAPSGPRIPPVPSSQRTLAGISAGGGLDAVVPTTGPNLAPMFGFSDANEAMEVSASFSTDESVTATLPRPNPLAEPGPGNTEESVSFNLDRIPPAPASSVPSVHHAASAEARGHLPPAPPPPSSRKLIHGGPLQGDAVLPPVISSTHSGPRVPTAGEVLESLALAGVFEPPTEQAPGAPQPWDKPTTKTRKRSAIVLGAMTLLFVAGIFGVFHVVRQKRHEKHLEAEQLVTRIETDLRAAKPATIPEIERNFNTAFELDSRSQRAALAWLRERAVVGLLKGGGDLAFEEATQRARTVGLKDEQIAFAQLASFLFQGDTVGAAALLPRFDGPAAKDAWYQMLAGATLERAGDARALERYATAVKLDPELVPAQTALVRLLAIDSDPAKADKLAKQFRGKYPDRAEGAALIALAWARDPGRSEQAPPEVKETLDRQEELPLNLAVVPYALRSLTALDQRKPDEAKAEVQKGLAVTDGPGIAVWLGSIAIATDDEQLARKAALISVSFSAVYPPARVLAARVALLGDRLDEALKATEDLEPSSPDVAIVRAAAAYERIDADGLARALEAIPDEGRKLPILTPVVIAQDSLIGKARLPKEKLLGLAGSDAPWGDLVAMDIALDAGDLETAKAIGATWKAPEKLPLRALRLARLARYEGRLEEADKLSEASMSAGTVSPRTLQERALVLVALGKASEVAPVLAKYPLVLGPLGTWLGAYALASAGKGEEARGRTAAVEPPPALAPLPARMIAAMALGAMKDKRGFPYVKSIYELGVGNPDMAAAGSPWGMRPPTPRK